METDPRHDPAVWQQMARQLGLPGLALPEEYGGDGFGLAELGVVLEEMGAALLCAPFFATVVLAAQALLASGDQAACAPVLPGIATGQTIATLAVAEGSASWDPAMVAARAERVTGDSQEETERRVGGWTLTGDEEPRPRRGDRGPGAGRGPQHRRAVPVRGGPGRARAARRADDRAGSHPVAGGPGLRAGARRSHRRRPTLAAA